MKRIYFIAIVILLFIVQLPLLVKAENQTIISKGSAKIIIEKYDAKSSDTLTLLFWYKVLDGKSWLRPQVIIPATPGKNGAYQFEISDIKEAGYFSISSRKTYHGYYVGDFFHQWLLEPGDDINIQLGKKAPSVKQTGNNLMNAEMINLINNYEVNFKGKGVEKFKCYFEISKMSVSITGNLQAFINGKFQPENTRDIIISKSEELLRGYKTKVSPFIYNLLEINIIAKHLDAKASLLSMQWAIWAGDNLSKIDTLANLYNLHIRGISNRFTSESAKLYSNTFVNLVRTVETIGLYLEKRIAFTKRMNFRTDVYNHLKNKYTGELRDKIIASLFFSDYTSELMPSLADALNSVSSNYYFDIIQEIHQNMSTGKPAYIFNLPDTNGKMISLADYRGKIVFIDFWYTGCSSCISFYKYALTKTKSQLKDNPDIVFMTISVDKEREKWIKSVNSGNYTSRDAVNLYTNGESSQHAVIKQYNITGYPHPMIIDREGKIYRFGGRDLRIGEKLTEILIEAINK